MNDTTKEKATKAAGFLAGLFTGWGLPATWAKAIAGAVVGALCAYFAATATGCTTAYTTTGADGTTTSWQGVLVLPVNKSNPK